MKTKLFALAILGVVAACDPNVPDLTHEESGGAAGSVGVSTQPLIVAEYINSCPNSNGCASPGAYSTYNALRHIAKNYGLSLAYSYWNCYQDATTPEPQRTATCTHPTGPSTNDVLYFYGCHTEWYSPWSRTVKVCDVGLNFSYIGTAYWDWSPVNTAAWYGIMWRSDPSPTGGGRYMNMWKSGPGYWHVKRCVATDNSCDPKSHSW